MTDLLTYTSYHLCISLLDQFDVICIASHAISAYLFKGLVSIMFSQQLAYFHTFDKTVIYK